MEIVFVRHGSTDWNRDHRFQGQVDIPLNDEGRAQAQALARALHGIHFDRVISSDLSRAHETARIVGGGAPVKPDARWREFAFGEWEGLTWDEIVERWPAAGEYAHTAAKRYEPPGGETFDALCDRVAEAIRDLQLVDHARILIVTHAGPLHAMMHVLFAQRAGTEPLADIRFSPGSITRVNIDGDGAQLLSLGGV